MNMEQRQRLMSRIHMLEGLLAYAERTGDEAEVARIRQELSTLVEQCGDGCSILESAVENHDLNEGTVYRDGWGRDSDDGEIPWKHSDMKDMACRHVYKLYLQLVMKGALQ